FHEVFHSLTLAAFVVHYVGISLPGPNCGCSTCATAGATGAAGSDAPLALRPLGVPAEPAPVREPVSPTRASRGLAHLAPGPHTARSERTPVTPAGSRRPPGADRLPRGTTQPARP
ncbi:hypothetical protein ABZ760_32525, partial [Streptomyces sp. NPDC006658]